MAPGRSYALGEPLLDDGWPKRIQVVEMEQLSAALGVAPGALFPYPVRIEPAAPGALAVEWLIVNVSPAKHRAYAVQWFSMATVLALFYLLRSTNLWQLLTGRSATRGKT